MLTLSLSFPAVFFTVGVLLALLYWVLVATGLVDLDGGDSPDILDAMGLIGVPLTVILSGISVFGWLFSVLGMRYLAPHLPAAGWLVGGGALLLSVLCTRILTRPLRPLFAIRAGPRRIALIGQTCTITTQRVDQKFGQAEVHMGGAPLLVQVRCDQENQLTKNTQALVVTFDKSRDAYIIEPLS